MANMMGKELMALNRSFRGSKLGHKHKNNHFIIYQSVNPTDLWPDDLWNRESSNTTGQSDRFSWCSDRHGWWHDEETWCLLWWLYRLHRRLRRLLIFYKWEYGCIKLSTLRSDASLRYLLNHNIKTRQYTNYMYDNQNWKVVSVRKEMAGNSIQVCL